MRRLEGWVMLEVLTGLAVVALLVGGISELHLLRLRTERQILEQMTREREHTLAVMTVLQGVRADIPAGEILRLLQERYPAVESARTAGGITLAGEEILLEIR